MLGDYAYVVNNKEVLIKFWIIMENEIFFTLKNINNYIQNYMRFIGGIYA